MVPTEGPRLSMREAPELCAELTTVGQDWSRGQQLESKRGQWSCEAVQKGAPSPFSTLFLHGSCRHLTSCFMSVSPQCLSLSTTVSALQGRDECWLIHCSSPTTRKAVWQSECSVYDQWMSEWMNGCKYSFWNTLKDCIFQNRNPQVTFMIAHYHIIITLSSKCIQK